jgi:hypothetical protein
MKISGGGVFGVQEMEIGTKRRIKDKNFHSAIDKRDFRHYNNDSEVIRMTLLMGSSIDGHYNGRIGRVGRGVAKQRFAGAERQGGRAYRQSQTGENPESGQVS